MKFCSHCGHPVERRTPPGDHLPRYVCPQCERIHYQNPKVIAGCIPAWGNKVILCRRAIEPRLGYWTFPAGYLELGETSAEGAAREALEETAVEVEVGDLLAVINVPHISQIYMVHYGQARSIDHHATLESSETALVSEAEIPWKQIAFPTIYLGLKFYFDDRKTGRKTVHSMDVHPEDWQHMHV